MQKDDLVIQVSQLVKGTGYKIVTTDPVNPILRVHLTEENFKTLGDTPLTLTGSMVEVFGFDVESGVLKAVFRQPNGDSVTWDMTDPQGENFKTASDNKSIEFVEVNQ